MLHISYFILKKLIFTHSEKMQIYFSSVSAKTSIITQ